MQAKSLVVFVLMAAGGWAQKAMPARMPERESAREMPSLQGHPAREVVRLPSLTERERGLFEKRSRRTITGIHREMVMGMASRGGWETTTDGRRVWRVAVKSLGALGLRIQFSRFSIGEGRVWIYPEAGAEGVQGPYSGRGTFGNGEFWSGTVFGDAAIVEYQPQDPFDDSLPFEIPSVLHRAVKPASVEAPIALAQSGAVTRPFNFAGQIEAASCHLDASCYPDWNESMKMVADIFFLAEEDGQKFEAACSGALVATTNNNLKPYFLTANHCVSSEDEARTVEALWTYQKSVCGGKTPDPSTSTKSQVGAHYLASGPFDAGDFSLLLLNDVPGGVSYAGWNAGSLTVGAQVAGIHHPVASWKRILFGHRVGDGSTVIDQAQLPASAYYIVALDQGIAEPGSSGSPLFEGPGIIIGTLTYGPAAPGELLCANPHFSIGYGRFSSAYPILQSWLEDLPFAQVLPSVSDLAFSGLNHAVAGGAQAVKLTTASKNAVTFSVRADAPWIHVDLSSTSVSAASPVTLNVTVDPKTLTRPGTYAGTITVLSGAAPPQFINVRATMNMNISDVAASVSPGVVTPGADGLWSYAIRLKENNGAATRVDLLTIDGVDYSSRIPSWFGTARLDANGILEASLKAFVLAAPVSQYLSIGGQDEGSGQRWYRTVTVTLNPSN